MITLIASIDIAAPPQVVREKFLDFSKLPEYHPNGFFKSITTVEPGKPFAPGVKMRNEFAIGTFTGTCGENTETVFRWYGGLTYLFYGDHSFRFEPSPTIAGGTKFTQEEKFTGMLAFLMGEGFVARKVGSRENTKKGWTKYNQDLKKWCEGPQ